MNRNVNKIILMAIAVVAIGIFALPSTMSLLSGQHTWYDLGGAGVPCEKCHADVHAELSDQTAYHSSFDCYACHRANKTIQYAAGGGGGSVKPGKQAHAASTIACMECHEHNAKVTQGPFAGGFRVSSSGSSSDSSSGSSGFEEWFRGPQSGSSGGSPTVKSPFNYTAGDSNSGVLEVHNAYVQEAIKNNWMEDSNEACIACHTDIAMEIDWTLASTMYSEAKANELGKWTMEQFEARDFYETTTFGTGEESEVTDSDRP
ncbi:MAG: cytochrome c3 family protein [Methanophagales archaeon]|nr:cytochrome c3 family protein [Methanophagales archaeon]